MKLINLLKHLLLEKKGDSYDSGCVMLYFKFPAIKEIHDQIDPEDLYTQDGSEDGRTYGIEDEPHITLLFGLDPSVPLDDVVDILDNHTYTPCQVYNASLFENEKYDVLKFDVKGSDLHETNEELCTLPYENKFPDYHPHMTIAYIKPGKGSKYTELFEGKEWELVPRYALYSQADGTKDKITIKVKTK